ncbi:MAG TPA: response regulator transcription factor [Chromatiales bacterium]|nr:response regulator transcription factor [Thiotrichales bacterium]HIP68058.1 response regulator transcription factor [Chromatiales bacterium]
MQKKILIIEDDVHIAELVRLHLSDLGHSLEVCHHGDEGWAQYQKISFDLVILDIMLPGLDGLEICKRIRTDKQRYTPILMLTSKTTELDRVLGLELGADDYLTKPFSLMEFIARVKALLRRSDALSQPAINNTVLEFKSLSINPNSHEVRCDGKLVELTAKEFDLLHYFAQHPGQVFSRLQLLDQVWGYSHEGYEHTVNSHMNRLRSKIEPDPRNPVYIKTIWGIGYQFLAE